MNTSYESTRIRLKEICDLGLISVKGTREEPGKLCLESAVALALGEPHSDEPSCVHEVDRAFAITLNDAEWPDPITRGRALYALGCAQLGTAGTDRTEWVRRLVEGTIRKVLPIALRAAADLHPKPSHQVALRDAADRCEAEGSYAASSDAYVYAYAAAKAARGVGINAAAYAYAAAKAYPGVYASLSIYTSLAAYASEAAHAARAATYAVPTTTAAQLHILTTAVEVALDAYRAEGRA